MTNRLGQGTVNIALNVTEAERSILGRLAFERDLSTGEFIRRVLRRGLAMANPEEAKELAKARRSHALTAKQRRTRAVICSLAFLPMLLSQDFSAIRSARRTARVRGHEIAMEAA